MDMGSSTMNMETSTTMAMSTATATGSAPAASSSVAMSMSMGGGAECKISMLWNWYTVDSCFIAQSWHITSHGMFAGSCIGVILLVMSLEFLRRASKEYDRHLVTQAQLKQQQFASPTPESHSEKESGNAATTTATATRVATRGSGTLKLRPNILQQVTRAGFHAVQFAVAYFIMLLAMYYNGYIIISIIIGAFLGSFVFSWENIDLGSDKKEETTYCCG